MPILESNYRSPAYLFNGHLQTIIPVLNFKRDNTLYITEKFELADGDFLELDWIKSGNDKLMIICHGLEGNSRSHYVQQMAVYFKDLGWDILALHARSCGREMNRLPILYHAGATKDIEIVVTEYSKKYNSLVLVGFSLGASMVLNYAGRHLVPRNLRAIGTFSVPCDLQKSEQQIDHFTNRIYAKQFLDKLKLKVRKLEAKHPGVFDINILTEITSIEGFTAKFTAPYSGFNSVEDLYTASTCLHVLKNIPVPTLIVNAKNDPFLSSSCSPIEIAKNADNIFLETPKQGGHTAFPITKLKSWMPIRLDEFLKEMI